MRDCTDEEITKEWLFLMCLTWNDRSHFFGIFCSGTGGGIGTSSVEPFLPRFSIEVGDVFVASSFAGSSFLMAVVVSVNLREHLTPITGGLGMTHQPHSKIYFSEDELETIFSFESKFTDRLISRQNSRLEFKKSFNFVNIDAYAKTPARLQTLMVSAHDNDGLHNDQRALSVLL